MSIDKFYPISQTMKNKGFGVKISLLTKLNGHLRNAKNGNCKAESKLCNRLGQIRRHFQWSELDDDLQSAVKESVEFLRSVGRNVDFKNEDPRYWITNRNKNPRW